ncbi:MAG: class I SAM-dependent methyltransferase [Congregibacter sp.]
MTEKLDFRFDERVSQRYDALRGHPALVSLDIGAHLAHTAGEKATILELGVGTGRMAKPLAAAGCEVVGVDLSLDMLTAIRADGGKGLYPVLGDIQKLPFSPGCFDAALCVHVLHLIPDWQGVLQSMLHLVRPAGALMLGRDWVDPGSCAGELRMQFRQAVVDLSDTVRSPITARDIVQELLTLGAIAINEGQEQIAAEWQTELTPRQILDGIRSKDDQESWVLPDDLLGKVMQHLDSYAAERWPDIDAPQPVTRRFVYSLFRVANRPMTTQ